MQLPVYSIAICPPSEVTCYVRELKEELRLRIGHYPSCHSEAHLSLTHFTADERAARRWLLVLEKCCAGVSSFEFRLKGVRAFSQGTVYMMPDAESRERFLGLCGQIRQASGRLKKHPFSLTPHLTIARQLDEQQLDTAFRVLMPKAVATRFLCSDIALRKFDPDRGQYTIVQRIPFGNYHTAALPWQSALW
ncbi:MAG: 2'-5' RNA ligase family protein [Chitinophagaceae bacterium]|nr:2'-5' RNA ligase family protein [Chitinophagaceae bacterium]